MMDELLYTQEDIDEWIRTCEELQERNRELKQEIAEYKDKIEQETIIELPCKVGDIFYGIQGNNYFRYCVKAIKLTTKGIMLETVYGMSFLFGTEAFLTREESEKRLKGEQE